MRKITLVFLLIISFFSLSPQKVFAADPVAHIGTAEVYQKRGDKECNLFNSCIQVGQEIKIKLSDISYENGTPFPEGENVGISLDGQQLGCWDAPYLWVPATGGIVETTIAGSSLQAGCSYKIVVQLPKDAGGAGQKNDNYKTFSTSSDAKLQCGTDEEQCNTEIGVVATYELCAQQIKANTQERADCEACFSKEGIWTAVGCIPSNPESVIKTVITIGLGIGGGVVLIMILAGSFMLSVSQGDPNKTKEAKEIITSAIIGLLFVIFSVTILQFIGVTILHIPGFGE